MSRLRAIVMAMPLALGLSIPVAVGSPALAADAARTGWWNAVSVPGAALPAPTRAPSDLRVGYAGHAPTAYAAVLYSAPGATTATLDLLLVPGRAVGTAVMAACPTKDTTWTAGPNQSIDKAPRYDCARGLASAVPAADGLSVSFALDASQQVSPGVWSLALVPQPDSTSTFMTDLQAPGPAAFAADPPAQDQFSPPIGGPDGATTPDQPGADAGAGSGGQPGGDALLLPDSLTVPAVAEGTAQLPLLADAGVPAGSAAATAPAPALAGALDQPVRFRPRSILARPAAAELPGSDRERLLVLLLLVGLAATVGYVAGQDRPGPRLIGGRAQTMTAGGSGASSSRRPPQADPRERGIGRFAKPRTAAPRRLR